MPTEREDFERDRKLFVGGLDYETTDAVLREYFEQYGELTDWVVMKFPDTKRSRGFGFITFKEPEMLEDCLSQQPHTLDSKTIELKRATPREDDRRGRGRGRGGRFDEEESFDPESKQMRKLFIGGLNYSTTEDQIRDYFQQFGELVDCVLMKFNDSGRSRGFGFVTFATSAQLDDCQAARPHILGDKTLETKRATPRSDSAKPESQMCVKKLFIGGVSDEMEDEDIRDYFSQYGKVINVEQLRWNESGKKRGFGFVEFEDYDSVDKVCLIGRHLLKGRRLEVKKALSKQEMNMMKKTGPQDVWGDSREGRGGGGGRRDDWRDDRDRDRGGRGMGGGGGGGGGGASGGGMNNMMHEMMNQMNMRLNQMSNMNMNQMSGMGSMMSGGMRGGGMGGGFGGGFGNEMGNMMNQMGGGMMNQGGGSSGMMDMMSGGSMRGGFSGGFGNDMGGAMGGFDRFNSGDSGSGSMEKGYTTGMRGMGRSGGPMRGPGGNQSVRDNSAPYTRRSMDRGGGGGGRRF